MSIFSNVYDSDRGQTGGQYFIIGRVKKIILGATLATGKADEDYLGPGDIGKIRYEILYSTLSTSKAQAVSEPAYPIYGLVKQYPLVNEIVLIIPGPTEALNDRFTRQQFFYFPAFAVWNNSNHGAFPNISEYADFLNRYANKPGYQGSSTPSPKLPLGYTFQEREIRNVQPFEGDSIIQARFGQSIRFGSTVPVMKRYNNWSNSGNNGEPITIITNSQGDRPGLDKFDTLIEDINKDGSSMWMTSTQEIKMDLSDFPLASFDISVTPAINNVTQISRPPVSNEFVDASTQDKTALG